MYVHKSILFTNWNSLVFWCGWLSCWKNPKKRVPKWPNQPILPKIGLRGFPIDEKWCFQGRRLNKIIDQKPTPLLSLTSLKPFSKIKLFHKILIDISSDLVFLSRHSVLLPVRTADEKSSRGCVLNPTIRSSVNL